MSSHEVDPQARIEQLEAALRRTEAERKRCSILLGDQTELRKAILGAVQPLRTTGRSPRVSKSKVKSPAQSHLVLTDWHIGEKVSQASCGVCYDLPTAKVRIKEILRRYLSWIEGQRERHIVDECIVWSLGDLVSGCIHEELVARSDLPVTLAVVEAAKLMAEAIDSLAHEFHSVTVHCISADNHGRFGSHSPSKGASEDNWSRLVHELTAAYVRGLKNVTMVMHEDPMPTIEVRPGQYIQALHGHQCQGASSGPSPYYSIQRFFSRQDAMRHSHGKPPVTLTLMGHYHSFAVLEERVVLCPSAIGPSEYSLQKGYQGRPGQLAFLLSDRGWHGMTVFAGNN